MRFTWDRVSSPGAGNWLVVKGSLDCALKFSASGFVMSCELD